MKHNGTGSFGYFWFLNFWLNKKLASEVKNTKNESGSCGTSNRTKSGTSGTDTMGWNGRNDGLHMGMSQCGTMATQN